MSDKLVSVLIPVFNAERFVQQAISSVLQQTYQNLEVIVINDGSTDGTDDIITKHFSSDSRVVYIKRENRGLIATLNQGVALAKGDYIARMDADDVCYPQRIAKQVAYLTKHPDVAVVGSAYRMIDETGNPLNVRRPPKVHRTIMPMFLFGSPFAHPAVMLNKALLGPALYYDENFKHAEDYELWLRLSKHYRLANLGDTLLDYRILNTSISRQNREQQLATVARALALHMCNNAGSSLLHSRTLLLREHLTFISGFRALFNIIKHSEISFSYGISIMYLFRFMFVRKKR